MAKLNQFDAALIEQVRDYVAWFLNQEISDTQIRNLLQQQARQKEFEIFLVGVYVDMVEMCQKILTAIEQQDFNEHFQAELFKQMDNFIENDVAITRLFRLHMIDRVLNLPNEQYKQVGNQVTLKAFIELKTFLGSLKIHYLKPPKRLATTVKYNNQTQNTEDDDFFKL